MDLVAVVLVEDQVELLREEFLLTTQFNHTQSLLAVEVQVEVTNLKVQVLVVTEQWVLLVVR
jgi:hypothetical protein